MAEGEVAAAVRAEAWLTLDDPTMTMDQAVAELTALGNTILEVDEAGRRVKCMDVVTELVAGGLDHAPADWQSAPRGELLR